MKLLRASIIDCPRCNGRGCRHCGDEGFRVIDYSYDPADVIERAPEIEAAIKLRARKPSVIEQRQADSLCVVCGSPNLHTRLHCEQHAKENAQRTSSALR